MSDLQKRSIPALIEQLKPAIAQALPRHINPERMARIALTAVRQNAALGACSPESFLGALLQAAQLGIEPNSPLGQCYLIPYGQTCTLVVGYRGMLDLARRSGMVKSIRAHVVREGDEFSYSYGLDPKLNHVPQPDDTAPMTHVYAVARLNEGEPIFTVLTKAKVETFRARSRAAKSGPWVTDYEQMSLKTAVRRLFPWLPMSAELARAVEVDSADDSERAVNPVDTFSPEVSEILASLPPPVPGATVDGPPPEGRRISLNPKKGPKPVDDEIVVKLALVDAEWRSQPARDLIATWTPEQRAEVNNWLNSDSADKPEYVRLP